jgi:hypothetical protein
MIFGALFHIMTQCYCDIELTHAFYSIIFIEFYKILFK